MANLTRYDPFTDLENLFGGFMLRPVRLGGEVEAAPQIKIDVKEDDNAYTVHADIPGAKKEDIKVSVDANQIAISAEVKRESEKKVGERIVHSERWRGSVYRAFTLDSAVDDKAAEAKYSDGVLELRLPKKKGGGPNRIIIS
ncbi:MAG: Hsp20/alpha crystallin family protein [Burkholderiales bacterium]